MTPPSSQRHLVETTFAFMMVIDRRPNIHRRHLTNTHKRCNCPTLGTPKDGRFDWQVKPLAYW